jgi:purine nucleoside permease
LIEYSVEGWEGSPIIALGLDPRFDLSKGYWLIAGGDPLDVPVH